MTIVEVRDRGGELIERLRFEGAEIRVGRGFRNDVVIDDEYLSAEHVVLTRTEDGWAFRDLGTRNGVRVRGRRAATGTLASGDRLQLGQVTLWVYDADHPVPEALPLDPAEARLAGLGRPGVALAVAAFTASMTALQLYWRTPRPFEPVDAALEVVELAATIGLVAAVWALVGRVLRHRAHFLAHLSVWLLVAVLSTFGDFASAVIGFNTGSTTAERVGTEATLILTTALAFWASATLASGLRSRLRVAVSLGLGLSIAAVGSLDELRFESHFLGVPDYHATLVAPSYVFVTPDDAERVVQGLDALFDEADRLAAEARDDED